MPSIGQIAGGASLPLSVGMALMKVPTPYTVAAGAALSLVGLVDKIGQGRKAATKFTNPGAPQDIINKQLAAISASQSSPEEKAQATDVAWRSFLQSANEFAAANPKQSKVVQQAIYQTPKLTKTVQSLLGSNPLDQKYTNIASQGMATGNTRPNPGPSVGGTLLNTAISAGAPLLMNKLQTGNFSGRTVGNVAAGPEWDPTTGQWQTPAAPQQGGGAMPMPNTGGSQQNSLLSRLAPQIISGGTSLVGGIIASRAAGKAAETQSDAGLEAARLNAEAGKDAIALQRDALNQQQKNQQPWIDAGTGALRSIQDITSAPGYGWNETYKAPTAEEAMNDPMIQFQLERGQKAVEANLRSKGHAVSGRAIKDITANQQAIAGQGYQRVRDNSVQDYMTRYNTFAAERSAELNPQFSLAGLGQTSTGQINQNIGTQGVNVANIGMTTAENVGNAQQGAANARASGYASQGNIWGQAFGNVGNNILDQYTLDQLTRRPISAMG